MTRATISAFATRAAIATVATFATRTARTTITAFAARAAIAARSALALYVTFGLGLKCAHRQTILAGLFVYFDQLHFYLIAFVQTRCSHVVKTFPRYFGNVEQSVDRKSVV